MARGRTNPPYKAQAPSSLTITGPRALALVAGVTSLTRVVLQRSRERKPRTQHPPHSCHPSRSWRRSFAWRLRRRRRLWGSGTCRRWCRGMASPGPRRATAAGMRTRRLGSGSLCRPLSAPRTPRRCGKLAVTTTTTTTNCLRLVCVGVVVCAAAIPGVRIGRVWRAVGRSGDGSSLPTTPTSQLVSPLSTPPRKSLHDVRCRWPVVR